MSCQWVLSTCPLQGTRAAEHELHLRTTHHWGSAHAAVHECCQPQFTEHVVAEWLVIWPSVLLSEKQVHDVYTCVQAFQVVDVQSLEQFRGRRCAAGDVRATQ
jgi:hypothetical protein